VKSRKKRGEVLTFLDGRRGREKKVVGAIRIRPNYLYQQHLQEPTTPWTYAFNRITVLEIFSHV
jgi:hypothetical protein